MLSSMLMGLPGANYGTPYVENRPSLTRRSLMTFSAVMGTSSSQSCSCKKKTLEGSRLGLTGGCPTTDIGSQNQCTR